MKHTHALHNDELLYRLSAMPRKIISLYDHDNVIDFVLHELCNEKCLDFEKAAYFIDNPDFDYCKGVAGFTKQEQYPESDIWRDPQAFKSHMNNSTFNQKVKSIQCAGTKNKGNITTLVDALGNDLQISDPTVFSIDLRHGNQGIFLCKPASQKTLKSEDDMINWLSYLGLCPVH